MGKKTHGDAPQKNTLRRRLNQQRMAHTIHGTNPLLFQCTRMPVVIFKLHDEIVGQQLAMELLEMSFSENPAMARRPKPRNGRSCATYPSRLLTASMTPRASAYLTPPLPFPG